MFIKLGFFVLSLCVLSQHTFVDAAEHSRIGNFARRLGDWQHSRGDTWDRKVHIFHIFDKSSTPQHTPIGDLKRGFGNISYKFADKLDNVAEKGKGILGQIIGGILSKKQGSDRSEETPSTSSFVPTNPNPAPSTPTETVFFPSNPSPAPSNPTGGSFGISVSGSTNFNVNPQGQDLSSLLPPDFIPTPENNPFGSSVNLSPPSISIGGSYSPPPSNQGPSISTGVSYNPPNSNQGPSISTGISYNPPNSNQGPSFSAGGSYSPPNSNQGPSFSAGGSYNPPPSNQGPSFSAGGSYNPPNSYEGPSISTGVSYSHPNSNQGPSFPAVDSYLPTPPPPTYQEPELGPPSARSNAGKVVFIDSQGRSTELTIEQIIDLGKYFDQALKAQ